MRLPTRTRYAWAVAAALAAAGPAQASAPATMPAPSRQTNALLRTIIVSSLLMRALFWCWASLG